MVIYDDKPVMIGAYEPGYGDISLWRSNASYFEVFDAETEVWSDLNRIPVFPELTNHYWQGTSVTKDDSFLVFGGYLNVYEGKSSLKIRSLFMLLFKNSCADLNCDYYLQCDIITQDFLHVMEYKNDIWSNLGT